MPPVVGLDFVEELAQKRIFDNLLPPPLMLLRSRSFFGGKCTHQKQKSRNPL